MPSTRRREKVENLSSLKLYESFRRGTKMHLQKLRIHFINSEIIYMHCTCTVCKNVVQCVHVHLCDGINLKIDSSLILLLYLSLLAAAAAWILAGTNFSLVLRTN